MKKEIFNPRRKKLLKNDKKYQINESESNILVKAFFLGQTGFELFMHLKTTKQFTNKVKQGFFQLDIHEKCIKTTRKQDIINNAASAIKVISPFSRSRDLSQGHFIKVKVKLTRSRSIKRLSLN